MKPGDKDINEPETIEVGGGIPSGGEGNTIYFSGHVEEKNNLKLNKQLRDKEIELLDKANKFGFEPRIRLEISCYGGVVTACMGTIDQILRSRVPVDTYVMGHAASAATLISTVGARRYIGPNSYMLIHQLSGADWGNFEQIKDGFQNKEQFMEHIYSHYATYTKIKKTELKRILQHDLWWNAKTCLKKGLVDEVA